MINEQSPYAYKIGGRDMYKVRIIYKSKFQKSHRPEPTVQYGAGRNTELKSESRGSLALGFGSANQRPPRGSAVIHARGSE